MGQVSLESYQCGITDTNTETDIAKASVAASRILEMRGKDQVDGKLMPLDTGNIGDDDKGVKIQFQNVWFRYPTRDVPILNGLNLTVGTHLPSLGIVSKTNKPGCRLRRDSLLPLLAHRVS